MDGLLKALIAAACVVVIAGGGYFVWRDNVAANAAVAAKEEATMRAVCAQARPSGSGLDAMRDHCKERGYY